MMKLRENRKIRALTALFLSAVTVLCALSVLTVPVSAADKDGRNVGAWDSAAYLGSAFMATSDKISDLTNIPWLFVTAKNRKTLRFYDWMPVNDNSGLIWPPNGYMSSHFAGVNVTAVYSGSSLGFSTNFRNRPGVAPEYVLRANYTSGDSELNMASFRECQMYFERKGSSSNHGFIYFYYANSSSDKRYLNIIRDSDALGFHKSDKTEWTVEYDSTSKTYRIKDQSGKPWYLCITGDGLTIVKDPNKTDRDCEIQLFATDDTLLSYGYTRFIDSEHGTDILFAHDGTKTDKITFPSVSDLSDGRRFVMWYSEQSADVGTLNAYADPELEWVQGTSNGNGGNNTGSGSDGILPSGEGTGGATYQIYQAVNRVNEVMYTRYGCGCKLWYAVYTYPLTVNVTLSSNTSGLSDSAAKSAMKAVVCTRYEQKTVTVGSTVQVTPGSWFYLRLPTAHESGYTYKITNSNVTGSTGGTVEYDSRLFRLPAVTKATTVNLNVSVAKAAVTVDTLYLGVRPKQSSSSYVTSGTANMGDTWTLSVFTNNPDAPDTPISPYDPPAEGYWRRKSDPDICAYTYRYTFKFKTNLDDRWYDITTAQTSPTTDFILPGGDGVNRVDVTCTVQKTRDNNGVSATFSVSKTVTLSLVCIHQDDGADGICDKCGKTGIGTVEVSDICSGRTVQTDRVLLSASDRSRCADVTDVWVQTGGGTWTRITENFIGTYYPDNVPEGEIAIVRSGSPYIGMAYTVSRNGTYRFRFGFADGSYITSKALTYDNLTGDAVTVSDTCNSWPVASDRVLLTLSDRSEYASVAKAFVKIDSGNWVEISKNFVGTFHPDNVPQGQTAIVRSGSPYIGMVYTVSRNGTYLFRFEFTDGTYSLSQPVTYHNITESGMTLSLTPVRIAYHVNMVDSWQDSDCKVTAVCTDGRSYDMSCLASFSGFDVSTSGSVTVTVTVGSLSASYQITVVDHYRSATPEVCTDGHRYRCTYAGCGYVYPVTGHTDKNHDGTCDECGVTGLTVVHTPDAWQHDVYQHWRFCTAFRQGCYVILDQADHVDANHDGECDVCGYSPMLVVHTDTNCDGVCDVCGASGLPVRHIFTDEWEWAGWVHYHICVGCGRAYSNMGSCCDNNHDGCCDVCGHGNMTVNHTADEGWQSDASQHWHACTAASKGCTAKLDPADHTDANHDGVCDVCGYAGLTIVHTDENHDGTCDICGATGLPVVHTYPDEWTWYGGFTATCALAATLSLIWNPVSTKTMTVTVTSAVTEK